MFAVGEVIALAVTPVLAGAVSVWQEGGAGSRRSVLPTRRRPVSYHTSKRRNAGRT